jgi:hypothetical protein
MRRHYFLIMARSSVNKSIPGSFQYFIFLAVVFCFHCSLCQQASAVTVRSEPPTQLLVVPNPSSPTCVREVPGALHITHQPNARKWVRADEAGVIFTFKITPALINFTQSSFKIFDAYGTSVAVTDETIALPAGWNSADSSAYDYDIYWNGTKSNGDLVHPGIYTAELKYRTQESPNPATLTGSFYMEKPSSPVKGNLCGTGYLLAFIPAIGFRLKRPLLKAFRKYSGKSL